MNKFIAAICVCCVALSTPVYSQALNAAFCGEYSEFIAAIKGKYKEETLGKGLTRNGTQIVELLASKDTFTILVTTPGGRTCMISSGQSWVTEPAKIKGR